MKSNILLHEELSDANGDFVVRQFTPNLKEHLDTTINGGVYSKVNGGDESKFVMQVSVVKHTLKVMKLKKDWNNNNRSSKSKVNSFIRQCKHTSKNRKQIKSHKRSLST